MTKIMIADDEPLIRKGLLSLIDWAAIDCEVVFAAANGRQIVEQLDNCKPDIIISDIKMPVMDGLELAQYLVENQVPAKLILLTAFADFDYAQQAIRYDVSDYVTKDGDMDGIVAAVIKCQAAVQKERQTAQSSADKATTLLKSVLDGTLFDPEEALEAARQYGLQLDSFCVVLADLVCDTPLIDSEIAQLRHKVERLIGDEFAAGGLYSFPLGKYSLAAVLPLQAGMDVQRSALELSGAFSSLCGHALYLGISRPHHGLQTLRTAGAEAEQALAQRFYDRGRVHLYAPEVKEQPYSTVSIFDALNEALRTAQRESCETNLQLLFALQRSHRIPEQTVLSDADVLFSLCKRALERIGSDLDDIGTSYRQWRDALTEARFFDACCTLQRQLAADTCRAVDSVLQTGTNVATDALNYIDAHFCEPITLKDIAAAVNVNPSYLSRCFKQKNGSNIVDTITQKRMEAAKQMILDGKLKMYEIAAAVGIEDTTYFSHVFRKYTGMSPKAYQDFAGKQTPAGNPALRDSVAVDS